jgi:hypothetical protein
MKRRILSVAALVALATLVVGMGAVPAFAAAPTVLSGSPTLGSSSASTVEETSSAVAYGWQKVAASAALGGSYATEHLGGARASYAFTGTSLKWFTVHGPDQGTAALSIDGVSFGRVDNYRPTRSYNTAVLFSSLTPGTHTLVITVEGLKGSPIGRGTFISIDGMQPGGAALQVRPFFTAFWRTGPSSIASGGHYALADLQGAAVSFAFHGTSVAWYSILGPSDGRAAVYLDGALKATVDLYRPSAAVGRFTLYRLSDAVHTLRIVVLGTRSAASHGTYVTVDRFAVS